MRYVHSSFILEITDNVLILDGLRRSVTIGSSHYLFWLDFVWVFS